MTNQITLEFIKQHEGCRLEAYQDSAGIWTIGYGHTGPEVHEGLVWSQSQADEQLDRDLGHFQEQVIRLVGHTLSEQQEAALVSFVLNVGVTAFVRSTMYTLLKQGDFCGAAKQFQSWDHAGGKELKGLLIRRLEEAVMFVKGS